MGSRRFQIGSVKKAQVEKSRLHTWFLSRENESCGKSRPQDGKKVDPKKKKVGSILGFNREIESCGKSRPQDGKKVDPKKKQVGSILGFNREIESCGKSRPQDRKKVDPK